MARRRKARKEVFVYECTMTEETFKTTREAPSPDDLVCVKAYYEMNPEEDDRPDAIKQKLGLES